MDTTLCYIEYNNCYLMLYRNKKKDDQNRGKWIGVGGKVEPGETVDACVRREVYEETGMELTSFTRRGIIDFFLEGFGSERMYLYTARAESSEFTECSEGTLKWIPKEEVMELSLWEGDRIFLEKLVNGEQDIFLTLRYRGDELVACEEGIFPKN